MRIYEITQDPNDPGGIGQQPGWEYVDKSPPVPVYKQPKHYFPKTQPGPLAMDPSQLQPAMAQLKTRCMNILAQFAATRRVPEERELLEYIRIRVTNNPEDVIYARASSAFITIDYNQFDDAPDNVLMFFLGHEAAHIIMDHREQPDQQASQQEELDADAYAVMLCKALGVNQAAAFKWLHRKKDTMGRTEFELRRANHEDPANADYYKNQATHPTYNRRFDSAAQQGFELSRATGQLDQLLAHMA